MMNRLRVILSAWMVLTSALHATESKEGQFPAAYITESIYWPEHVTYTDNALLEGTLQVVPQNMEGTLIRVETYGKLLVDFGRYGRAWVEPERTDFYSRYADLKQGVTKKFMGNLVKLIGPRLLKHEGNLMTAYPIEEVMEHEKFLLIYTEPSAERFQLICGWGKEHHEILDAQSCLPVIMPTAKSTDSYLAALIKKEEADLPFMRSHLSPIYAEVLQHRLAQSAMTAVLVDKDGRILARAETADGSIIDWEELIRQPD